ncbi:MAG: hypothetical protein WC668_00565 [Patescibacteria group bacterium]|jgi:hypothetical protein
MLVAVTILIIGLFVGYKFKVAEKYLMPFWRNVIKPFIVTKVKPFITTKVLPALARLVNAPVNRQQ